MRVDFNNYKEVNIGDVVFCPRSEQMGVVLSKAFGFEYGFMIEIMFESGFSVCLKSNDNEWVALESTGKAIRLSEIVGRYDPYGAVIEELRELKKERSKKFKNKSHSIG